MLFLRESHAASLDTLRRARGTPEVRQPRSMWTSSGPSIRRQGWENRPFRQWCRRSATPFLRRPGRVSGPCRYRSRDSHGREVARHSHPRMRRGGRLCLRKYNTGPDGLDDTVDRFSVSMAQILSDVGMTPLLRQRQQRPAVRIPDCLGEGPVRSALYQGAVVNRRFSIPSCLIFDSSVEAGMPSVAAAPRGPATFPRLFARAASIISFS